MDKQQKKLLMAQWKEAELRKAREALPLSVSELEELFDRLDSQIPMKGCDHSRRITEEWLASRGHVARPVLDWLDETGGYCDCEVLANSEEAFRYATQGKSE